MRSFANAALFGLDTTTAPARRTSASATGSDMFLATPGEKLEFVMTNPLANPAFRNGVTTGQCQEAC